MRVTLIHNRPVENNCYDDFAEAYGYSMTHWRDAPRADAGYDEIAVCCCQDPVGSVKARAIGENCLNRPSAMNRVRRDIAYATWRRCGLLCPDAPKLLDLDDLPPYPFLVKDIGKQMGKGFVIHDDSRLDWFVSCASYREGRYFAVPYYDLRNPRGHHELHRFIVCGDRVLPGVYAETRAWSCKASHMAREIKRWERCERLEYTDRLQRFWDFHRLSVEDELVEAVRSLRLDFALVDCALVRAPVWDCRERTDDETIRSRIKTTSDDWWARDVRPFLWEVNPYMNLCPKEVAGKRERWWPFVASYLEGREHPGPGDGAYDLDFVDAREQVELLLNWKGYKQHWRAAS